MTRNTFEKTTSATQQRDTHSGTPSNTLKNCLAKIGLSAALALASVSAHAAIGSNDEVGHILGSSIYRADLSYDQENGAADNLQRRILQPMIASYQSANAESLQPQAFELVAADARIKADFKTFLTSHAKELFRELVAVEAALAEENLPEDQQAELAQARDKIATQLEPPKPQHVWLYVMNWKFQQHLYDTYGGGRVLLQNFGPEAVDATVSWLKAREAAGDFQIKDAELRTAFYQQWQIETQFSPDIAPQADQIQTLEQRQFDINRYHLLNPGWFSADE